MIKLTSATHRVEDSIEAVSEYCYQQGWTDGLPVVPPTADRVQAMLRYTDLEPDAVVAKLAPLGGEATAEKIAINAVMAGCRPEYMPILIAAVKALADPALNLTALQTTTHVVAPLLVLNGPIARQIRANCGANVFGQGNRANATIGRAIRFCLINIGGGHPGITDKATFGHPGKYTFCIAENEAESPWEPYHVEMGFSAEHSTVTIIGAEAPHNVNDHGSTDAEGVCRTIASALATSANNDIYMIGRPVVVFGPEHAATVARSGWTKDDVRKFMYQHARVPYTQFSQDNLNFFIEKRPEWFSRPRAENVPVMATESDLTILVAGGPGKHSLVLPTFGTTRPVTQLITDGAGNPLTELRPMRD